jgi:hypothetical protein
MKQLSTDVGYPFKLFNERSFDKETVTEWIVDSYMQLAEQQEDNAPVINSGIIAAKRPDLFMLAIFGRICALNENYHGAFLTEQDNETIRKMYQYAKCDLFETVEIWEEYQSRNFGFSAFSMDREHDKLFKHDISLALNMQHIFFLDSEVDYHSLDWFASLARAKDENIPLPFSEEGINKVFRNIPIIRVW